MPTGLRFPLDLLPDRSGHSDGYEESRSSVDMENGPARVRNRLSVVTRSFNVKWTMSNDEFATFDAWWQEDIQGGTLEFDVQLLDDTEEVVWFTCKWDKGIYSSKADESGQSWEITGLLKTIGDSFEDRPSGTDDLHGRGRTRTFGRANMLISKVLFGRSQFDARGSGYIRTRYFLGKGLSRTGGRGRIGPADVHGPFFGIGVTQTLGRGKVNSATLNLFGSGYQTTVGRGRLNFGGFYGRSVFTTQGSATFPGYTNYGTVLQFDGVPYSPPDGGSADLQFDTPL